jgi:hypothetical protein
MMTAAWKQDNPFTLSFTTDTHLGMVTGAENDEDDAMMTAIDVLRRVVND